MDRFQPLPPTPTQDRDPVRPSLVSGTRIAIGTTAAVCASSVLALWLSDDATWYALPLLAALPFLWRRGQLTAADAGLRRGRGGFGRATLLPLAVVGIVAWLAGLLGATRVGEMGLGTLALQVSMMAAVTTVGTVFTEDGFFRGVLWGVLDRAGRSTDAILLWTATAYVIWILPLLATMPSAASGLEALAVHALNLWLLALAWGVLRLVSGSVLVAAWAHGLWNGLAYTLFGFGAAAGALGVTDPVRFDPERGWAGVAANAAALLLLRRWWRRHELVAAEPNPEGAAD